MNKKNILLIALYLSIVGILFSGYMTLHKLISKTCAFGESCPYLWGHPACLYGLIIFIALFLSILAVLLKNSDKMSNNLFMYTSILGVIYAGYFAYQDVFNPVCGTNCVYQLGLPTCVYGFIVFLAVFVCMVCYRKK
jgi:hypothetical protein